MLALMYHDVEPGNSLISGSGITLNRIDEYKISSGFFEKQIKYLSTLPNNAESQVTLTFDDGYKSAIEIVAPILEKHQYKGIFFIPTSFIGKPGYLSENDIFLLHAQGHKIGTHSHSHKPKMNRESFAWLLEEWKQSISVLNKIIPGHIENASVPGGWYSEIVAKAASEAG